MFPDLVKLIFVDPDESHRCFDDVSDCVVSERNPTGIPPWKMFSFNFWSNARNPFGEKWTVSPEDYPTLGLGRNTYLGYSIEESCREQPFIPHSQRENQIYILAKLMSFFAQERGPAWTPANFEGLTNATGMAIILGANNDTLQGGWSTPQLPPNHTNLGQLSQPEFLKALSKTRVLIGMGDPTMWVTPYAFNFDF